MHACEEVLNTGCCCTCVMRYLLLHARLLEELALQIQWQMQQPPRLYMHAVQLLCNHVLASAAAEKAA